MSTAHFSWLPTAISILRFLLIVPYAIFAQWRLALAVIIIVADKLDGIVARRLAAVTTLGSAIDTIADSVFVLSSWLLFYLNGMYGLSLLIFLLAPRFIVLASICLLRIWKKKWDITHLPADKIAGGVQYLGILLLLMNFPSPLIIIMNVLIINYVAVLASIITRTRRLSPV